MKLKYLLTISILGFSLNAVENDSFDQWFHDAIYEQYKKQEAQIINTKDTKIAPVEKADKKEQEKKENKSESKFDDETKKTALVVAGCAVVSIVHGILVEISKTK
ncbi:hypothetical protein M1446_02780 [Candidatus Dependentiae bacterium]|nr:hypothetical protein [Candidatus Dependentiae bacterium]